EGVADTDGDGTPNFEDTDSDGDGIPDRDEAGDLDCLTEPPDTDGDGTPDFLDLDSNGDGRPDSEQRGQDVDEDEVPDAYDIDLDGDGIPNPVEMGVDGLPTDSDSDGTPDHLDIDSDGDTIADAAEGRRDSDGDGTPNFRDLDADGDGIDDALEAGDGNVLSAPVECSEEIDFLTGDVRSDGLPDFLDGDRDNDGASDADEVRFGTDLCGTDSDSDGFSDLIEIAREQINCPDGVGDACGCATDASCGIPGTDFFVVLPFGGEPQERDLTFATDIRTADIFFLTDTTGSMGGTLNNVKEAVAAEGTGLIAAISETIPDAWFGGGQHDDFPFGSYGSGRDEPFILAIRMTPPERAPEVSTAFRGIDLHSGGDGPESHVEALFRIMTGDGEEWTFRDGRTYNLPNYRFECLDGGWGAACFREGSLPIVVHFTDICAHNGPPGESESSCNTYRDIEPAPAAWGDAIRELNRRGAKYVGINASSRTCSGVVGPSGNSPCYFLRQTAEATSSIDLDGSLLVYDLPNDASQAAFRQQVTSAVETVATRVPIDVSTALRDDPDPSGVDATRFITRRQPGCRATPPTDPCWTPPEGVSQEAAVAAVDESTFFGAVPGTEVLFRITFQNTFFRGNAQAQVLVAFIDVRGSGAAVLDTRQVFIVIPASSEGPG
ncbi:MAG: hypothetical protein AAF411_14805, partial [Myxococcota bacterium]